jgi:hypothetical protein
VANLAYIGKGRIFSTAVLAYLLFWGTTFGAKAGFFGEFRSALGTEGEGAGFGFGYGFRGRMRYALALLLLLLVVLLHLFLLVYIRIRGIHGGLPVLVFVQVLS